MIFLYLASLAATLDNKNRSVENIQCKSDFKYEKLAKSLGEIPEDVSADLRIKIVGIGDYDSDLILSDSEPNKKNKVFVKFMRAYLIRDEWFVVLEVGYPHDMSIIGYRRTSGQLKYTRWPLHYFGGDVCKAIGAATHGVTTPGGFGF